MITEIGTLKIKTLHIIEGIDKTLGGLPYALSSILGMEHELGISNTILSLSQNSMQMDNLSFKHSEIVLFSTSFPKRFRNSKRCIKWLKNNVKNYDLVVFHSVWSILHIRGANIAKKNNIPYVIWPHGSLDPFDLKKKSFFKKLLGPLFIKMFLSNAEYICCTTNIEIDQIECYGAKINLIELSLPIDKLIKCDNLDKLNFKEKWSLEDDYIIFLFLSRIDYKKGLEKVVYALSNLPADNLNKVKVIIAGKGELIYVNKIKKLVKDFNLTETFIFTGHIVGKEKTSAFEVSDVFLLPSENENFGIVLVEALNSKLPVLITKNVYIWEKIVEYDAGWICENNYKSLSETILYIVENRDYLNKKQNTRKAGNQYSIHELKKTYRKFYEKFDKSINKNNRNIFIKK